jgi:hypothetical protein
VEVHIAFFISADTFPNFCAWVSYTPVNFLHVIDGSEPCNNGVPDILPRNGWPIDPTSAPNEYSNEYPNE